MNDATQFFNTVAGGGGYEIERSLRFNSADSAYLNRTPSVAGNRKTWTWAGWVKRSGLGTTQNIFDAAESGTSNPRTDISFGSSDTFNFQVNPTGSSWLTLATSQVFRDASAWGHLVIAVDTTQTTDTNRVKLYWNGAQITQFSSAQYPNQNSDLPINNSWPHSIGRYQAGAASYFNGYLADVHFIDGQALDPTSFGEFDTNGVWQPIEFVASGPNNGTTWSSNPTNFTNPGNAFSGSSLDYAEVSSSGAKGTFTFPSSIQVQNNVTFAYSSGTSGNLFVNNSSTAMQGTSLQVQTISFTGTLTDISLQSASQPVLYYFAVDGVTLIDGDTANIGLNGFHLPFSDNSTAAALGTDTSSNGNTWTVNNLNVAGSVWNQSQTWSNNITGGSGAYGAAANAFNGSLSDFASPEYSSPMTYTNPSALDTVISTFEIYGRQYSTSITLELNDTDIKSQLSTTVQWHTITGFTGQNFSKLYWRPTSGNLEVRIYAIRINGKILVDQGLPDPLAKNIDSLVDSPTNYGEDTGAGGEVRGNYATLNPLDKGSTVTLVNGSLDVSVTSPHNIAAGTVMVSSGKYYAEFVYSALEGGTSGLVGVCNPLASRTSYLGGTTGGVGYNPAGSKWVDGANTGGLTTSAVGDVIGIALDKDSNQVSFYKNNTLIFTQTGLNSAQPYTFAMGHNNSAGSFNFGQRPFAYTAPSGFKALCTTNLAEPTIADGSTAMDVALYTGNGSTQTISGLNFSPDLVWIKSRSNTQDHYVFDFIRDSGILRTNTTGAETTGTDFIDYNSDGFVSKNGLSSNGYTYAAWCWDAGSSTVTNTQGSITSQVRANPGAGFSVVTYTGNGTAGATVGHGLGVAPQFVISKRRDAAEDWWVGHVSPGWTQGAYLQVTDAFAALIGFWNNTAPTSSVVTLGTYPNTNTGTYVMYCFAPVAGYSSFGSYTGNGSADGPFVYTGFRPRWVLFKCSSDSNSWQILDAERDSYNEATKGLFPNLNIAEISNGDYDLDLLSNGVKIRTSDIFFNGSGKTYIYAAFAEHPFATARAR
jgi:hypothetical protein